MKKPYLVNFKPGAGPLHDIVFLDDTRDLKKQVLDYIDRNYKYNTASDAPLKPSVVEAIHPIIAVATRGQEHAITLDGVSPKPEVTQ